MSIMSKHTSLFISCMNRQCVQISTFLFSLLFFFFFFFFICSEQPEIIGVVKQAGLIDLYLFSICFVHWSKGFLKLPAFIPVSKMRMCNNWLQDYHEAVQWFFADCWVCLVIWIYLKTSLLGGLGCLFDCFSEPGPAQQQSSNMT